MKQNKPKGSDVADSLKAYLGEEVVSVVRELIKKKDYSEFKLAEAIKKEVNDTRNLLYRLNNLNLASFIKKKDHKVGWYIHYWTFHEGGVGIFLLNEKRERLEVLKEIVLKENLGNLFVCENGCVDMDFDKALDSSFRCPECGELLDQEKSAVKAKGAKAEVAALEKEIGALEVQEALKSEERLGRNKKLEEAEAQVKHSLTGPSRPLSTWEQAKRPKN